MRVCTVRGTELRVHPLLFVVAAGACVLGRLYELLWIFLALTLHEASHALTAWVFGCRIRSVELMPFGGVARLGDGALSPHAEWCVAAAGPVTSFVVAGVAAMACVLFPRTGARMQAFLTFNLTLGVVNLLPALPLDGGRIARCALQKHIGPAAAARVTGWTGVCFGAGMLAASVLAALRNIQNLSLPVMGAFLLLAAAREIRALPDRQLAAAFQRMDGMRAGEGMDVHQVAASERMRGMEAMRLMRSNRFNLIRIVDERMRVCGELDETALVIGLSRLGTDATVGEILQFDRKRRLC